MDEDQKVRPGNERGDEEGLKAAKKFYEHLNHEDKATALVLRAHMLTETYLEQIIAVGLKRGDRILGARFTYSQKLTVVAALDIVDDDVMTALRALNKLRNDCAHQLEREITESDVEKIGRSLGRSFTKSRAQSKDHIHLFQFVVSMVGGRLYGHVCNLRDDHIAEPKPLLGSGVTAQHASASGSASAPGS